MICIGYMYGHQVYRQNLKDNTNLKKHDLKKVRGKKTRFCRVSLASIFKISV